MSCFKDALDTLTADPNLSAAGTYTRAGNTAIAVRMVGPWRDDARQSVLLTGSRYAGYHADLRQWQVPLKPLDGDRLDVTDGPLLGAYLVLAAEGDNEGITWRCDLQPV